MRLKTQKYHIPDANPTFRSYMYVQGAARSILLEDFRQYFPNEQQLIISK